LLKCLGSQRSSLNKEGLGYTPKKGKAVFAPHKTSFMKKNDRFCNRCKQVWHLEQYCKNKNKPINVSSVTEPPNYTRLNKKIIHRADNLANLNPYNPVVREITTDFKPTYIPAKIVISLAVTITSYIKVRVVNTSEFRHSYYKPSSNKSSESI
jgi:hypothetical protein